MALRLVLTNFPFKYRFRGKKIDYDFHIPIGHLSRARVELFSCFTIQEPCLFTSNPTPIPHLKPQLSLPLPKLLFFSTRTQFQKPSSSYTHQTTCTVVRGMLMLRPIPSSHPLFYCPHGCFQLLTAPFLQHRNALACLFNRTFNPTAPQTIRRPITFNHGSPRKG